MNLIYKGKTKDVYRNNDGTITLKFKDDVTQLNGIFDPGANSTGLKIDGAGKAGLRLTEYFFKRLKNDGIPTHFINCNINENAMTVKPVRIFGKGLEVICRLKATGSFLKRFSEYVKPEADLDYYVEITIKNDDLGDPFINEDALLALKILDKNDYKKIVELTKEITKLMASYLKEKNIILYDIKYEFGKNEEGILLIDEISGGNMRAYKDNKILLPLDLSRIILE